MTKEQERHIAECLLSLIEKVEYPILIFENDKRVAKKALLMYLESIAEGDTE